MQVKIEYIDKQAGLAALVAHLEKEARFSFDLEFDSSRYSYGFTLCLIQIGSSAGCFIVDPLVGLDLSGLFGLFERADILKVAHCGEQDLRLLHSLGCRPKQVRDTETMARLLNYEFVGLSYLLREKFEFEMDKKLQVSNWNLRPLKPAQIEYAANDVIFLLKLHDLLWEEATAAGLESWVEDETTANDTVEYGQGPTDDFLTKIDRKECSEAQQFVLNGLLKLRDRYAQKYNKPPYQIIDNQLLRDLVTGKESFANWVNFKTYKALRTVDVQRELTELAAKLGAEATEKGLSTLVGRARLSPAERAALSRLQAERERIRVQRFKPIQQIIIDRYGLNTARYLLSEGYIGNVLKEQTRLSELRTPYRRQLILDIAQELNIDLQPYI